MRVSPAVRMNNAQTVTTAGLLNPAMASWGVTSPVSASADSTISPTRSTRSQPPINRTNATRTIAKRTITSTPMTHTLLVPQITLSTDSTKTVNTCKRRFFS